MFFYDLKIDTMIAWSDEKSKRELEIEFIECLDCLMKFILFYQGS